jgi:hypothetical protein
MKRLTIPTFLMAGALLFNACSEGGIPTEPNAFTGVVQASSHFVCGPDGQGGNWDEKIDPFPEDGATIERDEPIVAICLKPGNLEFLFTEDGSVSPVPGCTYTVSGLGTTTVVVTRTGSGEGCPGYSHVEIWFGEVETFEDLVVEKTAEGSYDRTVTWELEKTVDPESHSGAPGDEFSSDWLVEVTKSELLDNYKVIGTITIYNPNDIDVDFAIDDVLDDGTVATVTCPDTDDNTGTVPAASGGVSGEITCDYEALPTDDSATKNTATVTPDHEDIGANVAEADVTFIENLIGDDEVLLEDDEGPLSETLEDSDSFTYPGDFACPTDLSLYTDGLFEYSVTNVATLTGDNTYLEDDATVTVTCVIPVTETAWAANGTTPLELRYTPRGNWATYVEYEADKTVNFYAGQTILVGTVHFSAVVDDEVTITIDLNGYGWEFAPGSVVAIQGYETAPSGNPEPGLFEHKFPASGTFFQATVPAANFYGVHAVVQESP